VATAADRTPGSTGNGEDGADDNGDDAERPDDGDVGDEPDEQQYYSENDHDEPPSWGWMDRMEQGTISNAGRPGSRARRR